MSFARHYTASNDCSPSRSALLTGLYTHQTGCLITGASTLDPGFPTWGTMLREHGYHTRWLGKWHVTRHDNRWTAATGERALEHYGFAGGIYPSPDGAPGQGWRVDPHIATRFADWFAHDGGSEPWCTTVSFVNPHDIAWWYAWSERVAAEASAAPAVRRLPPNFETPELLLARHKPRLQRSFQDTAAASFGPVPFTGPDTARLWLGFLDLYTKLQREMDRHVGQVLDTLESRPEVAANTVVVFTSDHGEYGASHGLRGKGASAYEEGIRVPLIVKDPRGVLTAAPERARTQLTSSVDVAPLLLTIATGSEDWRREEHYSHIAGRLELARILADPTAPGRPPHPARHRRDRHRVRDRTLRGGRPAARRRAAHAQRKVRDLLQLARRGDRAALPGPGRRAVRLQLPQRTARAAQQRRAQRAGAGAARELGARLPAGAAGSAARSG